jgi:hypothetical protein
MGKGTKRATHIKILPRAGATLLETVIALGVWFILSTAVIFAWQYVTNASARIIARNQAFENARFALDTMLMNIQLYDEINLTTHTFGGYENVLVSLAIPRRVVQPSGGVVFFSNTFFFDAGLPAGHVRRGRIERSGPGNEMARHIALVRVIYVPGTRIDIIIKTDCEQPVILEGSACVRYKKVVAVGL